MNYTHTESDLQIENEYPKLVRDKIPEIIKAQGKNASVRKAKDDTELFDFLFKKLIEESSELINAIDLNHQKEELADVHEVLDAIRSLLKISEDELKLVQKSKSEDRGAFAERLIMLEKV